MEIPLQTCYPPIYSERTRFIINTKHHFPFGPVSIWFITRIRWHNASTDSACMRWYWWVRSVVHLCAYLVLLSPFNAIVADAIPSLSNILPCSRHRRESKMQMSLSSYKRNSIHTQDTEQEKKREPALIKFYWINCFRFGLCFPATIATKLCEKNNGFCGSHWNLCGKRNGSEQLKCVIELKCIWTIYCVNKRKWMARNCETTKQHKPSEKHFPREIDTE